MDLSTVRERWAKAPTPDSAFLERAAAVAPERLEDLFLAWWCGTGDAAAIVAFEETYADDLRVLALRFRDMPSDELRQALRVKLFVGDDPKIREYGGSGSLKAWLRVTAIRCFIDLQRSARSQHAEPIADEDDLFGIVDPTGKHISAELGAAVKAAFTTAVAKLEPRQRVFLRHAYVDRHTLDQIATHYSVHRATVARTLAAARERLFAETRAGVVAAVGLTDDAELASVIRQLDSRIDLSLSRVFGAGG